MDGWPMISMDFAKEVDLSLGRFAKAQIACAFQVGGTDQWRKLRRCLLFLSFASLQFLCSFFVFSLQFLVMLVLSYKTLARFFIDNYISTDPRLYRNG